MVAILQGALDMIQSVMKIKSAAAPTKSAGIKRERVKNEEVEEGARAQVSKRSRKGENREVIMLD